MVAVLVIGAPACGGDDSGDAETKTVTSRFLASGVQGGTPGSGGFIETPQRRTPESEEGRDEPVPAIRQAASGESVFTGVLRDAYLKSRSECGGSRVKRRSAVTAAAVYAARYGWQVWQAAFEGCAVGIASR
jgi:hypothetical protein